MTICTNEKKRLMEWLNLSKTIFTKKKKINDKIIAKIRKPDDNGNFHFQH
jgi:hypothetical protein